MVMRNGGGDGLMEEAMAEAHGGPRGAGKSSFDLGDAGRVFALMGLRPGMTLLDVGCGRGLYALAAARTVGAAGAVLALDAWEEGLSALKDEAAARGLSNICAVHANAGSALPLPGSSVDAALLATVLHDLAAEGVAVPALSELARVLRPGGVLAVVEFKKIEGPPGPPIAIRLTPEEVLALARSAGLAEANREDLGGPFYVMTFRRP